MRRIKWAVVFLTMGAPFLPEPAAEERDPAEARAVQLIR
jgi:hypothetical protein